MSKRMSPSKLREVAESLRREFSDPPLCCVCGEPLTWGSSSREGAKWAHYVPHDGLYDKAAMEHTDRSTHWDPKPDARIVALANHVLKGKPSPRAKGRK